MGGALSGEHGVGSAKLGFVERQLGGAQVDLMRRIKRAFDPAGILNPGKKIPDATGVAPVSDGADLEAAASLAS
jgi:FAD/FMN-containing dehydrogenase